MTDLWCFDCRHELKRELVTGRYVHLDPDDLLNGCPCADDGEECGP
jgi:hypothetical protein